MVPPVSACPEYYLVALDIDHFGFADIIGQDGVGKYLEFFGTVADEEAILAAQAAYDALTPAQQAKVDPEVKQKLDDAVAALQNAKDQAAADVVADQITALPAVADFDPTNAAQAQAVADAKNAYDALTDAQKAKVGADALAALEAAEAKIAELKGGSTDIDVSKIDNKTTGATITANGNVLTVACDQACVVAYTTNGTDYTKVAAVKNGDKYDFTLPAGVTGEQIAIVKRGDITGDGEVDDTDVNQLNRYANGKRSLDPIQILAGDVTGDGEADDTDVNQLNRLANGKRAPFAW